MDFESARRGETPALRYLVAGARLVLLVDAHTSADRCSHLRLRSCVSSSGAFYLLTESPHQTIPTVQLLSACAPPQPGSLRPAMCPLPAVPEPHRSLPSTS